MQLDVDAQLQVLACHGTAVELTVLIAALHASVGVAQQNLYALLASQLFLVAALNAQLADVVAWLVVVVGFNIALRHFCNIA